MGWTVAIGIDTHRDGHVAVALDRLGGGRGSIAFTADAKGYLALWRWAQELGESAFAIEGTGSYGAGLARFLVSQTPDRVRNRARTGCTGMNTHNTHLHELDVDETWIAEWSADGLAQIERYLAKHAAFAEYLRTRGVVHCDDGDRRSDA